MAAQRLDVLAKKLGEDPVNKDMALTVNPLRAHEHEHVAGH